jgi:hypothetical protein
LNIVKYVTIKNFYQPYEGLSFNFSFAELLPAAKIQFLFGDIGYLFSSDVGYFYDSLGKMFLKECFDLRHDLLKRLRIE